jgi:hypothetical protein
LLGKALCAEYSYRYGRTHKCESVIDWCKGNIPSIPEGGLSDFPQAMPDKYKDNDAVVAYRGYYIGEKASFCNWTKRGIPEWFKTAENG